jgi:Tfp pilus assembly protein PilF
VSASANRCGTSARAHRSTGSPRVRYGRCARFSQGLQAFNQGDNARALQLIEEALAEDTMFAMAYRKLAIMLSNQSERAGACGVGGAEGLRAPRSADGP